jgi:hypothetical protein
MVAEMRDDIASSVQLGLVLPLATRAACVFRAVNIRLEQAAAGRLSRSERVLRYRSRAPSTSHGGGAPAGSDACRGHAPRGTARDTPSRRSPQRSSMRLRRPCVPSGTEAGWCQLQALRKVSRFSRCHSRRSRRLSLGLVPPQRSRCRPRRRFEVKTISQPLPFSPVDLAGRRRQGEAG